MKKILLILAVLLSFAVTSNAQIINVNSLSNHEGNPVSLLLNAGTYDVMPIGTADGGLYNAWNAWSNTSDCDVNGENCINGWLNAYYFSSGEFGQIVMVDGGIYATPALALSNAINTSFTLTTDATVNFYIRDGINGSNAYNNVGGMSLDISPPVVPEPISSTLFIVGGATLGFRRFRKKFMK